MPTTTSPPILVWTPGGGIPVGPVSNPPVYSQNGVTQLVQGQAYIDVVFGSVQTDTNWVLVACDVDNTTDVAPLNIWPGIITNRTTAGFRLQLNGLPDSGNYYLHWAVSGINIAPSPATSYSLTGPTSGGFGVASTFTVALPPSATLTAPVVVTPNDGGGGGTFSPTFVTLTTSSPTQTFTYTPASYGNKTISTTNSGPLTDPASIVFTVYASTYTLTGPSSGTVSVASTNFTVALPAGGVVTGTVTVTSNDSSGGGTFTPTTVNLTTGAPSATFTYTPASAGAKTISVTNNGGLTNPGNLTYTVSVPLPTYSLAGPSSGTNGVNATFTVTLAGSPTISGTVTVTPNDGGAGGTFTPTTVGVTDASPIATFTYKRASTGTSTINATNDRGLTNPTGISFTSVAPIDPSTIAGLKMWMKADSLALADGATVSAWNDSSANGYNLNSFGTTPTFKTNIVNGKPVVRFNGTSDHMSSATSTDIGVPQPITTFVVGKQPALGTEFRYYDTISGRILGSLDSSGHFGLYSGAGIVTDTVDFSGAFHVFVAVYSGGNSTGYVDGNYRMGPTSTGTGAVGIFNMMNASGSAPFYPGDVAEILIYNSALSTTDRNNVANYLRNKYALP